MKICTDFAFVRFYFSFLMLFIVVWFIIKSFFNTIADLFPDYFYNGCSTLVGQRPMKSLPSVCLSVCRYVTKVLQDWIITFFNIVHDDSWSWYLVTDKARKKNWGPEFGSNGPKMRFFAIFLSSYHKFFLKLHTMITYDNV